MCKQLAKHLFFITVFTLFSSSIAQAQEADTTQSKWFITSGFGVYNPPTLGTGNLFYSEIGYQLSTGYNLGVGFGMGDIFNRYKKTSIFEGMRKYDNYYLMRLFINRPFNFGSENNHQFKIGSGFVYIQPRFSHPDADLIPIQDNQGNITEYELVITQDKSTSKSSEMGFPIILEYGYRLGPLTLGVRYETHILCAAGAFESFILSPQISLDF